MNLRVRNQRLLILAAVLCLLLAVFGANPYVPREVDAAHAVMPACVKTQAAPKSSNDNTLNLGNGTTVSPCIPNAPIHMRIGYADGGTGGSVAGSTPQFVTDGITFPDGQYSYQSGCLLYIGSNTSAPHFQVLKLADGTHTVGPDNVMTKRCGTFGTAVNDDLLYAEKGWAAEAAPYTPSSNAQIIHMRLKNLRILKNAYMTVTPQSNANAPTAAGSGEYKLAFTPQDQAAVDWNIGDADVFTDLWVRADGHIKVDVFGINTSIAELAGGDGLWADILAGVATGTVNGLELDVWAYYINASMAAGATGKTPLRLPHTNIQVTP